MLSSSSSFENSSQSTANWRIELSRLLRQAVEAEVFPGAVLQVQSRGEMHFSEAQGFRTYPEGDSNPSPIRPDTVYDVAGLTGSIVTATLIMKLIENGKLNLKDRVSRYVQAFGVNGKSVITIQDLLGHVSGLSSSAPYYEELIRLSATSRMGVLTSRGAKEYVYNVINRSQLKYPPATKQLYSEIGLIVLGNVIEILTGMTLDKAATRMIFQPLNMKGSSFIDLSLVKRKGISPVLDLIAPTEDCPVRKRVLCGEVNDENAWAMGGVSGHSGLFSMANDISIFAAELLRCYAGNGTLLKR
jgi:serine-type D-Ala-D-Ala carboxypeptidase